jgi:ferric-dicitrate binding protein FerR (iron transport regulator)
MTDPQKWQPYIDPQKWQRYIDNQCEPEEKRQILMLLQNLAADELEGLVGHGWSQDAPPMPVEVQQAVWTGLQSKIAERRGQVRYGRMWLVGAAAACIVLLASSIIWLIPARYPARLHGPVIAYRVISNSSTEVKMAMLPDSSMVWLTPQSTLTIGSDFNTRERRLQLSGEGYFEVSKDASRPFTVVAGALETKVLGTHFNIESYPGESRTIVSLTQGSVSVKANDNSILLKSGTRLSYSNTQKTFTKSLIANGQEKNWRQGVLVLNDLSMPEAFHRLSVRFGKTILFSEPYFRNRRFAGTYDNPRLELVLTNMAFIQGFRYRLQGDTVLIQTQ